MSLLKKLFPPRRGAAIVVVSGLPRSGTSMLMKMLQAGGLAVFSDGIREADIDNPNGYFEHENIRKLAESSDRSWLGRARGQAIKVIAFLLDQLPPENNYDVIYVNRQIGEVVASQNKMLERRGESVGEASTRETAEMLSRHSTKVKGWLKRQKHFRVLEVDYAVVVQSPAEEARRVSDFLEGTLDCGKMAAVVDPSLYRNRSQNGASANS